MLNPSASSFSRSVLAPLPAAAAGLLSSTLLPLLRRLAATNAGIQSDNMPRIRTIFCAVTCADNEGGGRATACLSTRAKETRNSLRGGALPPLGESNHARFEIPFQVIVVDTSCPIQSMHHGITLAHHPFSMLASCASIRTRSYSHQRRPLWLHHPPHRHLHHHSPLPLLLLSPRSYHHHHLLLA